MSLKILSEKINLIFRPCFQDLTAKKHHGFDPKKNKKKRKLSPNPGPVGQKEAE
ncbi:hypothetical protein [Dyadobacter soli]|uniref:hypothetical protein n=1 Tax=Dyadobacter soli TaxID=659014 RepID=UPI0015A445AA|nr:hypothetical protein [Dyadobacter soli]